MEKNMRKVSGMSYLRQVLELRYGIWIADECQTSSARHDIGDVFARLMCQVAQYGEDSDAGQEAGERVRQAYNHSISDVMGKASFW